MPVGHSASRIAALVAALAVVATVCPADDRVRMAVDNVGEIDVKDRMQTAAQAVADEDLDAFVGCFAQKQQPRIRRRAALLFAMHELDLELLDCHLVEESGSKAEMVVKYRVTMTEPCCDIVSLVNLTREQDAWRIVREQVKSQRMSRGRASGPGSEEQVFRFGGGDAAFNPNADDFLPADIGRQPGGGCANGRCGVPR